MSYHSPTYPAMNGIQGEAKKNQDHSENHINNMNISTLFFHIIMINSKYKNFRKERSNTKISSNNRTKRQQRNGISLILYGTELIDSASCRDLNLRIKPKRFLSMI